MNIWFKIYLASCTWVLYNLPDAGRHPCVYQQIFGESKID